MSRSGQNKRPLSEPARIENTISLLLLLLLRFQEFLYILLASRIDGDAEFDGTQ